MLRFLWWVRAYTVAVMVALAGTAGVAASPAAAVQIHHWCVGHLGRFPVPPPVLGMPFRDCRKNGYQHK